MGLERLGDEGEPEREREREGEGKVSTVIEVERQTGRPPPGGAGVACRGEMGRAGPPCTSGGDEPGRRVPEGEAPLLPGGEPGEGEGMGEGKGEGEGVRGRDDVGDVGDSLRGGDCCPEWRPEWRSEWRSASLLDSRWE